MRGPVITPDMVQRIRKLLAEDLSQRAVAATLGISRSSVKKYQTEEAVERRRVIAARSSRAFEERRREARRKAAPPEHLAIRTASPIVRMLFEEMWRQGLKQADVAKRIGVHPNIMTSWKKGVNAPSLFSVEAMAQVLGFTLTLSRE